MSTSNETSNETPSFGWPGISTSIPKNVMQSEDPAGEHNERSLPFKLEDHLIDGSRPMKVIIAGMGFSGIIACIRIQQKLKNIDLQVYEKNSDIGGTWFENNYPGVACDIPAYCYQLTFSEKENWSSFYAPGGEICAYLREVVEKYKLRKFVQLSTEVTKAEWNEEKSKWVITTKNLVTLEESTNECDLYIPATGFLNAWKWPEIEGIHDFKGIKEHSAHWQKPVSELKGKRIAVIGNGSSAIQIIPQLAPDSVHLDTYIRGPTWIALPFAGEEAVKRNPTGGNFQFTSEELAKFAQDKDFYKQYRLDLENELNSVHEATIKDSPMQMGARAAFKTMMQEKLSKKKEVADFLIPTFPVACRRLTPGPNYLETLASEKVDVITTHIKKITETGIEDKDGVHREYDVIVCATGFDTSFKPRYPFIGRRGVDLRKKWAEQPNAYLALAVDEFPNCFMIPGPNSGVGSGSLLVIFERQVDYMIKVLQKMQREQVKTIEVKKEICDDWSDYIDAYFEKTVYSEKCRTWYKGGKEEGRVMGLWPGSCLHAVKALESPRWEDYNMTSALSQKNRLAWLGNGWTQLEKNKDGNRAFYLEQSEVDVPPIPSK